MGTPNQKAVPALTTKGLKRELKAAVKKVRKQSHKRLRVAMKELAKEINAHASALMANALTAIIKTYEWNLGSEVPMDESCKDALSTSVNETTQIITETEGINTRSRTSRPTSEKVASKTASNQTGAVVRRKGRPASTNKVAPAITSKGGGANLGDQKLLLFKLKSKRLQVQHRQTLEAEDQFVR